MFVQIGVNDAGRGVTKEKFKEQLETLIRACSESARSAVEVLPLMFRRPLAGLHLFLALGEALAHLEYLVQAGRLHRSHNAGLIRYQTAGPS